MVESAALHERWKLIGGSLCLDFANTAGWHASDRPGEFLRSYADLVDWARHAGALDDRQMQHLLESAGRRPREAGAALEEAVDVREALYRIFSTLAASTMPDTTDLAEFNLALRRILPYLRIGATTSGMSWTFDVDDIPFGRPLWAPLWSAAELLTGGQIDRVRRCAAEDGCGWLFLDLSRNRSRRWCDSQDCGNRTRVRRYYKRRRAEVTVRNQGEGAT